MGYFTEPVAIERIIKEYPELLFKCKFENLEEMGHFLKNYQLPKFSLDEIDNLKSLINY